MMKTRAQKLACNEKAAGSKSLELTDKMLKVAGKKAMMVVGRLLARKRAGKTLSNNDTRL